MGLRRRFLLCLSLCLCTIAAPSASAGVGSYLWVTAPAGTTTNGIAFGQGAHSQFVSADGRFVVFSVVGSLVPEDTDATWDVYLRDLTAGSTVLVSAAADGSAEGPVISANGRFIAYSVFRPGVTQSFVHDRVTGTTSPILTPSGTPLTGAAPHTVASTGAVALGAGSSHSYLHRPGYPLLQLPTPAGGLTPLRNPALSADGSTVIGISLTNTCCGVYDDLFAYDVATGTATNLTAATSPSIRLNGVQRYAISADGRFVIFTTDQGWLGYLVGYYDRATDTRGPLPNWQFLDRSIPSNAVSADGRYVSVRSPNGSLDPTQVAPNTSSGAWYLYIYDRHLNLYARQTGAVAAGTFSYANAAGRLVFLSFSDIDPLDTGLSDLYASEPAFAPPDTTPPTIDATLEPPPNDAGWSREPTTVSFVCADEDGGSGVEYCPPPVVVDAEGSNLTVAGTTRDRAGNERSVAVTVNLDLTPPTIGCGDAVPSFTLGAAGATLSATLADTLSGVVDPHLLASVSTATVGLHSADLVGADLAGNTGSAGCPYRVEYRTSEFEGTIESPPTVNVARAGQSVPVRWRLTDASGTPVSDPASFSAVTSRATSCHGNAQAEVVETSTGGSGLHYLGDGWWRYNWDTPRSYAGQCRIIELKLADGGAGPTALFEFR